MVENVYKPETHRKDYSQYYETSDSDSPKASRDFLNTKILETIKTLKEINPLQKIKILSVGSGKQIVEKELELLPEWKNLKSSVEIYTLDIANLTQEQLLTKLPHTQASGNLLPFADNTFDIVYSNMAIDFMPRQAFAEVARVQKKNGCFLVNFHHPNLIPIAKTKLTDIESRLRTLSQKIQHGSKSTHLSEYREKLERAKIELNDTQFIINHFPSVTFKDLKTIQDYFNNNFNFEQLSLEEHIPNPHQNGWFYFAVRNLVPKNK